MNPLWPPYGLFERHFLKGIADKTPPSWRNIMGYFEWYERERDFLSTTLWPLPTEVAELEVAAGSRSTLLIATDLKMIAKLQDQHHAGTLELFEWEDAANDFIVRPDELDGHIYSGSFGASYLRRNPDSFLKSIPLVERRAFFLTFETGYRQTSHCIFRFKRDFQRLRPYTAAFILDNLGGGATGSWQDQIDFYGSQTARHPSFISGHALQGLMSGAHAFWKNPDLFDGEREELLEYSAAIGDRRVFASLHYPSDSLASWIVALSLIPNVFDDGYRDVALPLVSDAIRSSLVYLAIEAHVSANLQSSPYTAAWKRLQSLLKPSTASLIVIPLARFDRRG